MTIFPPSLYSLNLIYRYIKGIMWDFCLLPAIDKSLSSTNSYKTGLLSVHWFVPDSGPDSVLTNCEFWIPGGDQTYALVMPRKSLRVFKSWGNHMQPPNPQNTFCVRPKMNFVVSGPRKAFEGILRVKVAEHSFPGPQKTLWMWPEHSSSCILRVSHVQTSRFDDPQVLGSGNGTPADNKSRLYFRYCFLKL